MEYSIVRLTRKLPRLPQEYFGVTEGGNSKRVTIKNYEQVLKIPTEKLRIMFLRIT